MSLSVKHLDAIKGTKGKTLFEADEVIGGLGVRYGKRGRPSFTLVYRFNGKQQRRKLGLYWNGQGPAPRGSMTLADARAKAAAIKDDAARGIDTPKPNRAHRLSPGIPPDVAHDLPTVANLLKQYGRERLAALRTGHDTEKNLEKHLLPSLGTMIIGNVKPSDVRNVLAAIMAKGDGYASNRVRACARTFFGWAVEFEHITDNPVAKVKPLFKESSRDRVTTDDEILTIWEAVAGWDANWRDVVRALMVIGGTRLGETSRMHWSHLDLAKGEWHIPASEGKNNIARTVYLSKFAMKILTGRDRIAGSDFVFTFGGTKSVGSLSTYFCRLKIEHPELNLADVQLHDFRRAFASGLASKALGSHNPIVIDRCLGHSAVLKGVAAVYQRHEFADERRAAFKAWSDHVESLVTPRKRAKHRA